MRTTLLVAATAALLFGLEATASANVAGYACLLYNNGTEPGHSYGDGGYVIVGMYSDPQCTNFLSYEYFCSAGATSSRCSGYVNRGRSEVQLSALFTALQKTQHESQRITIYEGPCNGGASGCAYQVLFWSPQ